MKSLCNFIFLFNETAWFEIELRKYKFKKAKKNSKSQFLSWNLEFMFFLNFNNYTSSKST